MRKNLEWIRLLRLDLADEVVVRRGVGLFVAVGVALRLWRYALAFPLWCDEYQLAANLLDRDFRGLLWPLEYNQVAPVGFLWIELASVRWLGFAEWSLRLLPALCGIGSVLIFPRFARRFLCGVPLLLAVAIFSVSYYPIRYSAEVKPYGCDLFASLVLLSLLAGWWQAPQRTWRLWCLAAVAPVLMAISFPAVFVAGAVSLTIGCALWSRRGELTARSVVRGAIAWGAFNLLVAATFLTLLSLNLSSQYDATQTEMLNCWAAHFPPWRRPLELPLWLVRSHTSELFAYPIGGEDFGSIVTALAFFTGLVVLWKSAQREFLVVVAGCFGLSLLAAAMQRYPYGGHARLSQYLAPLVCVVAASGAGRLFELLPRLHWRILAPQLVLAGCLMLALGFASRDAVHPYKAAVDRDHREFARTFWRETPGVETLCVQNDLYLRFYDHSFETPYLCYQALFSPSHRHGARAGREIVAAGDRPLRCVVFHSASARCNRRGLADWLQGMCSRYNLISEQTHQIPLCSPGHADYGLYLLCYDVYCFEPRSATDRPAVPIAAENLGFPPRR